MRLMLIVVTAAMLVPLVRAVAIEPTDLPTPEPIGTDRLADSAQYWNGHEYCSTTDATTDMSLPTTSYLRLDPVADRAGYAVLSVHFHVEQNAASTCPPLTIQVTVPFTSWPTSAFADLPIETSCGHAYLTDWHSGGYDTFAIAAGPDGCVPGLPGFGSTAYVYTHDPSFVCDPFGFVGCTWVPPR